MGGLLSTTVSVPLPVLTRRALVGYTCALFALALVLGGSTRQAALGDAVIEIAALPLLGYALLTLRLADLPVGGRLAVVMAFAIIALPLLQLIPLPSTIWSHLPGRAQFAGTYEALGLSPAWLPVSLDPPGTWRSVMSLIPALSLFLVTVRLTGREKRTLLKVVIPIAVVSVLLDCLQMMGGPESALRFYTITNTDRATGLFANSNHNATFLFSLLPLLIGMVAGGDALFGSRRMAKAMVAGVFVAIFVGLALTQSRAGLALGFLATVLATLGAYAIATPGRRIRTLKYGAAALAAALLLAFQFGFLALAQRVENQELIQDLRWPVAAVTLKAASVFAPVGSGLGTFQPVYEMTAPRTLVRPAYVNHAHDDWLELWLEGGVPAAVLAAAFLALYGALAVAAFRSVPEGSDAAGAGLARAAAVSIALILLHSTVDYPLRTVAIMSLFAVYAAMLVMHRRT